MKLSTRHKWFFALGMLAVISAHIYSRENAPTNAAQAAYPAPCLAVNSMTTPLLCVSADSGRLGFIVLRSM